MDIRETRIQLSELFFKQFVENLPIGSYQADNEGKLIYCNSAFAEILCYESQEELIGKKLTDFYTHYKDRDILMKKMEKYGGFVHEFLYWKDKNGNEICLSDSCQFVFDLHNKKCGVRGFIIDVWYGKLVAKMSEGAYKIGSDLKTIERANPAVARIFGFNRPHEIEGKFITDFYKFPDKDWPVLLRELAEKGEIRDYIIPMKQKGGSEVYISVNALPIKDNNGKIVGREGTFRDVTEYYTRNKILEDVPTGAYQVRNYGGKSIIKYCNSEFARMFGYEEPNDMIEQNLDEYHLNKKKSAEYKKRLEELDREGLPLHDYEMHLRKKNGAHFWVKVDGHLLRDHDGKVIGRQGTLRDCTKLVQLQRILGQNTGLEEDKIHQFAHRFMAPIMSIKANSEVFNEELSRLIDFDHLGVNKNDIENHLDNPIWVFEGFIELTKELLSYINDLVTLLSKYYKEDNFVANIKCFTENLHYYMDLKKMEKIIELREEQRKLEEYLQIHREDFSTFNPVKKEVELILFCLKDLNKFYLLYMANIMSNTSKAAYVDVENLRSYLLVREYRTNNSLEFRRGNLHACITEVINVYLLDAIQKRLTFKFVKDDDTAFIDMSIEHIKQMLHCLIQNAVKYSFKRPDAYVLISLSSVEKEVVITIENYGVGILPDEIESENIYEYGTRGEFANDWNRTGSGIGLSEAKKIAEMHLGKLTISSKPLTDNSQEITKDTPHLTCVKIKLKKKLNEKENQL